MDLPWIEAQISAIAGTEVTVIPWPFDAEDPTGLVAAIVQSGPLSAGLESRIQEALSPSIIPVLVTVPDLPLTTSGKRDLHALANQVEAPLTRQSRRQRKLIDRLISFALSASPNLSQNDLEYAANLMEAGLDSLAFTEFVARVETAFDLDLSHQDVALMSRMTLRQMVFFLRRISQSASRTYAIADLQLSNEKLRSQRHYRAMRTIDFLQKFPSFLTSANAEVIPMIGSSGFMRGLDTKIMDQIFWTHDRRVQSANIGMAMLSNLGICEICAYIAETAELAEKRFPLSVLELELLQLSVLPPAGDIEILKDFKSGAFEKVPSQIYDADTMWDLNHAGSLTERQGPWRQRDSEAKWQAKRHNEIRAVFDGDVSFDSDALEIWKTSISHLAKVSDHIAVVLHPLDRHVSRLGAGHGCLKHIRDAIQRIPNVTLICDHQFDLEPQHFRNFSHLNERGGRRQFSTQLAHHLIAILNQ